jgi:hypothetical protein
VALTRQDRVSIHKKQERSQISEGAPLPDELSEGVPTFRSTSEGVVEYVLYKGILYKKVLDKA